MAYGIKNKKHSGWGLVLRPTEAGGGYLAPHLKDIEDTLENTGTTSELHYTLHGQCQIQLPPQWDEMKAHALASRLNELTDDHGRPVLEVEITSASPPVLNSYPAKGLAPEP